jgi:Fe-S oxidoreductase
MSPVSLTYWGVPGYVIFWGLSAVAAGLFVNRVYRLWKRLRTVKGWDRFDQPFRRLLAAFSHVFLQWCQIKTLTRRDFSGLGHMVMAWAFFIYVVYYVLYIIIGAGLGISVAIEGNRFFYYYSWVMDIAAPLIVLAALWGILRRYAFRPARLKGEQTIGALVILVTVIVHPITHLLKGATGLVLGYPPAQYASLPAVSAALSGLFGGLPAASVQTANNVFFWAHWGVVLFVLVYIGYSRYLHVLAAPLNILLRPSGPRGALRPVDFTATEAMGAHGVGDFPGKYLLDSYACVACGRCQDACPAFATGKPLSPKKVVQDIRGLLLTRGAAYPEKSIAGQVITADEIRACTTCGACVEVCPVGNDQVATIIELRRNLVYEGSFERGQRNALSRVARDNNPWGLRWNQRISIPGIEEARPGKKYDCIYWLGCVAAFDDGFREVARAMGGILKAAGLKFAVLGTREKCCGDFVRRLGDEGLFQQLAATNIQTLKELDFGFVLTHCPHCFNTIKNEYQQFGGDFRVVHHTRLIHDLLSERKLILQESTAAGERVAYHDPCYLGRYNGIYREPRQVLRMLGAEVLELRRHGRDSFCCGAGGGSLWTEQEAGQKISLTRLEEALAADPRTLVTACPFCYLMFQEAFQLKGAGRETRLRDIAEIVERQLITP